MYLTVASAGNSYKRYKSALRKFSPGGSQSYKLTITAERGRHYNRGWSKETIEQGRQTLSVKGQMVKALGFVGCRLLN